MISYHSHYIKYLVQNSFYKYKKIIIWIKKKLELFDCCAVDGDASAQASLIVDCLKWDSSGCICINLDYYFLFEFFLIIIFYLFFPPCIDITGKYHGIFKKINIIKDPEHRHDWIVIFHSYHIISLLDIPSWSYGWKIGNWHIWPNFCDLWPLTYIISQKNAYLLQSFLTNIMTIGNFKLKVWLKNQNFGLRSMAFVLKGWPLTHTFS